MVTRAFAPGACFAFLPRYSLHCISPLPRITSLSSHPCPSSCLVICPLIQCFQSKFYTYCLPLRLPHFKFTPFINVPSVWFLLVLAVVTYIHTVCVTITVHGKRMCTHSEFVPTERVARPDFPCITPCTMYLYAYTPASFLTPFHSM